MCVCMYVCMYVCLYVCMFVCMYVCVYVCMYVICVCIYIYICIYVYIYIHASSCLSIIDQPFSHVKYHDPSRAGASPSPHSPDGWFQAPKKVDQLDPHPRYGLRSYIYIYMCVYINTNITSMTL